MSAPLAACSPTVVGRMYLVPCLWVRKRSWWMPRDGWVPTIGPRHTDAEFLEFPHEHYHVDWRFIPQYAYDWFVEKRKSPLGSVITNDDGVYEHLSGRPTSLKLRKCRRDMPEFPGMNGYSEGHGLGNRWHRLEVAQAFACNKLKADLICPHRGIDLKPFVKPDGTVICPGHGIRWDTHTGEMLPHHHAGEAL